MPDFAITTEGVPPVAKDDDVRIASLITKRLGIDHEIVRASKTWMLDEKTKNLATNFCLWEGGWAVPFTKALSSKADSVFDGFGGDILSQSTVQTEAQFAVAKSRDLSGLAKLLLGKGGLLMFSHTALNKVLSEVSRDKFSYEAAIDRTVLELEKHLDQPNPVKSFRFWNRGRREIAPFSMSMAAHHVDRHLPYLYPPLFDLLISSPAEFFFGATFHDEAIHRAYPDFRDIPFEEKTNQKSMPPDYWRTIAGSLFIELVKGRGRSIVDHGPTAMRFAKYWAMGTEDAMWISPEPIQYLLQLEGVIEQYS